MQASAVFFVVRFFFTLTLAIIIKHLFKAVFDKADLFREANSQIFQSDWLAKRFSAGKRALITNPRKAEFL